MYLACCDELIDKKRSFVEKKNARLIIRFLDMPFWAKWKYEQDVKFRIWKNWAKFETWQKVRMKSQGTWQ